MGTRQAATNFFFLFIVTVTVTVTVVMLFFLCGAQSGRFGKPRNVVNVAVPAGNVEVPSEVAGTTVQFGSGSVTLCIAVVAGLKTTA